MGFGLNYSLKKKQINEKANTIMKKDKKISLMYSLLNVGRLYLVLGFISLLVYLNIPDEMNESTMAVWILGLSSINFVLGIRRLIKHYKETK